MILKSQSSADDGSPPANDDGKRATAAASTRQASGSVRLSEINPPAPMSRMLMTGMPVAVIVQLVLLILAGWKNRYMLDPDGVAYMRIASYYAGGKLDLAISGYWGPMLSWLIAPLLGVVENPLFAARIVMGISAVVFLFGCISIFRSMELHPAGMLLGTWIAALMSVAWSVAAITPDLLMSGLLCMAISRMISRQWTDSPLSQLSAGLFLGAAYLAKAVAFPVAILTGGAIASLWVVARIRHRAVVLRSLSIALLCLLLFVTAWTITLSVKYKSLVLSTSGKIAHAIAGPPDNERYHPSFRRFHTPETGRITSMEDPTHMPYRYWSPFENLDYARHQLTLIYRNAEAIVNQLAGFSSLHLGLFAAVCGLMVHSPWHQNMGAQRWRWAGVVVASITGIYLPVYALDQQYYFAAYPFLFAAGAGLVAWMTPDIRQSRNLPKLLGLAVITVCFALPARSALEKAFVGTMEKQRAEHAYELARKLQAAGVRGSIAGGSYDGLYVAFLTDQPWHGDELNATARRFKASGARLAIVHRNEQALINELNMDAAFIDLDSRLFPHKVEAAMFPLKAYQIIHP